MAVLSFIVQAPGREKTKKNSKQTLSQTIDKFLTFIKNWSIEEFKFKEDPSGTKPPALFQAWLRLIQLARASV
jgi:hypothetical protein